MTFVTLDGESHVFKGEAAAPAADVMVDRDALLPKVRSLVVPLFGDGATEALIAAFGALHAAAHLPDIAPELTRRAAE